MSIELEIKSNSQQARTDLQKLNGSVDKISQTTQNATKTLQRLAIGATAAFAAIGSARAITNVTDSYRRLEARIALATDGLENQAKVFKQLNAIALETRSSQEGLADLYSRIARATKQLGVEQETVIQVTRSISQAITISGASAESANSAIVQLGQGLAAGALRGQELNSVMEQTPAVAQAIARGMGITIGQLRAFANEGKLTAEAVVSALKDQSAAIDSEFAKVPPTFAQALLVFGTGVGRIVNELDQVFNFTNRMVNGLLNVGKSLNASAAPFAKLVAGIGGGLGGFGLILSELGNVFRSVGKVAIAFVKIVAAAFERLIPLELLIAIQRLKNFFVVELVRGTGEIVRFLTVIDVALFKLASSLDVFRAGFERSLLSRGFRTGAVGLISAIGDIQAQFALFEAGIIIFGANLERGVRVAFITLNTFFGIVENSFKRIIVEFSEFRKNFDFGLVFSSAAKEVGRLRFIVDTVADVTSRVIGSFKHAYIEIVGNSWWPDTIDGVINYAKKIKTAFAPIKSFLDATVSVFANTYDIIRRILTNANSQESIFYTERGKRNFQVRMALLRLRIRFENTYKAIGVAIGRVGDILDKSTTSMRSSFKKASGELGIFLANAVEAFGGFKAIFGSLAIASGIKVLIRVNPILGAIAATIAVIASLVRLGFINMDRFRYISELTSDAVSSITQEMDLLNAVTKAVSFSKGFLAPLETIGQVVRELARPLATAFSDIFGSTLSAGAVAAISILKFGIPGVIVGIGILFSNELLGGVDAVLNTFSTSFSGVVGAIAEDFGRIAESFTEAFIQQIPNLIRIVNEVGAGVLRGFFDSIPLIGTAITSIFSLVNTLTAGLASTFVGGALAFLFFGGKLSTIGLAISNLFRGIKTLITGTFVATGPNLSTRIFGSSDSQGLLLKARGFFGSMAGAARLAVSQINLDFVGLRASIAGIFSGFSFAKIKGVISNIIFGKGGPAAATAQAAAGAAAAASAANAAASKVAGASPFAKGGILRKLIFGALGAITLLGSMGAFASDAEGIVSGISLGEVFEYGLMAVAIFGTGGIIAAAGAILSGVASVTVGVVAAFGKISLAAISAGTTISAVVGAGLTAALTAAAYTVLAFAKVAIVAFSALFIFLIKGLTAVLVHPVFLTIAAIVAGLTIIGGIFGALFFGKGDGFFNKLENFGVRIADYFGIINTFVDEYERKGVFDRILGDVDLSQVSKLNDLQVTPQSPQDIIQESGLNLSVLTGGEFEKLVSSSLAVQDASYDLRDLQQKGNSSQRQIFRVEERLLTATQETNAILKAVSERLSERGTELIESGTEDTSFEKQSQTLVTTFLKPFGSAVDMFAGVITEALESRGLRGLEINSSAGIQKREDDIQQSEGFLSAAVADELANNLERLNFLQSEFAIESGNLIRARIGAAEAELAVLQESNIENKGNEARRIAKDIQKAVSDGIENVQLFGFAERASKALEAVGVDFSRTELLAVPDSQRVVINDLVAQYDKAVERFNNSSRDNIAANSASVAELARTLALSAGSQSDRFQTAVSGAGLRADNEQFVNADASQLKQIKTTFTDIAKLQEQISSLGGTDLIREQELFKQIQKRRREGEAILASTRSLSVQLAELSISQTAISRLSNSGISTLLSNNASIAKLLGEQGTLTADQVDRYKEINRLVKEHEDSNKAILTSTISIGEALGQSAVSQLQLARFSASQSSALIESQGKIAKLQLERDTLGLEEIERYKEVNKLIADQLRLQQGLTLENQTFSEKVKQLGSIGINLDLVEFTRQTEEVQAHLLQLQKSAQSQALIISDPNSSEAEILAAARAQAEVNKQVDHFNELMATSASISETFREGFASAFKDVITGAESVGDAILGLLTKIGDQILDKSLSNFTDSIFGGKGEGGFGDQVGAAGASITGLFGKKEGEGAIGAGPNGTDALPLSVKVVQGAASGALSDAISPFSSDDALKPEDAATPITDKIDPLAGLGDSAGEDPAEAAKETTLSLGGLTTMVDQATGGVLSFGSNILSSIASIFGFSTSAITGAAATSTGASAAVSFTGALTAAIVALGVFNASLATGAALSIIPGFATGGPVKGPGTGTSDDILASLSNGEYVINARSTRKNRKLLEAINNGADISKFADGGMVGVPKDMSGPLSKGAIDNRNQQKTEQVFNINVTGDISRQTRAEIQAMIPDITRGVNSENMEQGTR